MKYNFDINEIKNDFEAVIKTSQHFPKTLSLNTENILQDWLKAKEQFIEKMNGNLFYISEEPVSFELDLHSKEKKYSDFLDLIYSHYQNDKLYTFLTKIPIEDFFNNIMSKEYISRQEDIRIPKGYKVIKAFKFFISSPNVLKDIQSEASRILQENSVNGYLCFSVHPLDFLSASENTYNWRSCHALDGEYRSGNLSYLMDSSTVICYLTSKKPVALPHFPKDLLWNSKKWRVWFHFSSDKNMLFAGRQYPFFSETGINLLKNKIFPKVGLGTWSHFYEKKISTFQEEKTKVHFHFSKMVPIGFTLVPMNKLIQTSPKARCFNDVLHSSCYEALYAYRNPIDSCPYSDFIFSEVLGITGKTSPKNTKFNIGEECKCPICGERIIDFSDVMACRECNQKYLLDQENNTFLNCDICGTSVDENDLYCLEYSSSYVCPTCYKKETEQCEECGIIDTKDIITYHDGRFLCPDCIQEYEENKIILEGD